ncbi:hypothetical protein SUDANB171_02611 [Streptomyces sp. enrichment culture]|jgi:hypothetical protein
MTTATLIVFAISIGTVAWIAWRGFRAEDARREAEERER